jgi:hypothetical protein
LDILRFDLKKRMSNSEHGTEECRRMDNCLFTQIDIARRFIPSTFNIRHWTFCGSLFKPVFKPTRRSAK